MIEFEKRTTNEQEECFPVDDYLKMRNILSAIKMVSDLDSLSYEDRFFHIKTFLNDLSEEQYDLCVFLTDKRIDSLKSKIYELEILRDKLEVVLDDMNSIMDDMNSFMDGDSND